MSAPMPPSGPPPGPAGPGAQPSPAKPRFPGWAWILVAICGVLFLAVIGVVVAIVSILNASQSTPIATPTPTPTTELTPTPTPTEASDDTRLSLDDRATAAVGPYWSVPGVFLTDWETVVFDEEGLNHFQNTQLNCEFQTFQGRGVGDQNGASDRAASEDQMDVLQEVWAAPTFTNPTRTDLETVWVNYRLQDEVELLALRLDGPHVDTGEDYTTFIVGREFIDPGSALAARIVCPTSVFDGPESPLEWILQEIAIVDF